VLHAWHRHGEHLHDVVVFGLTRRGWERSRLRDVPAAVTGTPPDAFTVG
jgi:ribosomal-protein-alanine N-acetyltransferase